MYRHNSHVSGDSVTITPANEIVQPRGNVTIKCHDHQQAGLPDVGFGWNVVLTDRSTTTVVFADGEHYVIQNNILMILNITTEYAGKYFCERITQMGSCISNKSDITIFGKFTIIATCVLCDPACLHACMERPQFVVRYVSYYHQ